MLRYCVIFGFVALVGFLLLQQLDSYLASNPSTSRFYGETKARVSADIAESLGTVWSRMRQALPTPPPQTAQSPANGAATQLPAETRHAAAGNAASPSRAPVVKMRPYITAGLTRDEVEEIQGPPTESTDSKLVYDKSELYFVANHLTGWKIDPSTPLRVKLWPDSVVDPDLKSFAVGSSKNEVLVVQGTPNLLSEDRFGYGGSEVFFKNNRVIGWRDDPTTVPLRVTSR